MYRVPRRFLRTVFFGTDDVSLPTLQALRRLPAVTELAVVTAEPRGKIKGVPIVPPVLAFARENALPVHFFPDRESASWADWPARLGGPGSWCVVILVP